MPMGGAGGLLSGLISSMAGASEEARAARRSRQAAQAKAMQQQAIMGALAGASGGGMPGGGGGFVPGDTGARGASQTVRNILGHNVGLAPITYGKGKSTLINAQYAGAFQGLLNELQRAGYNIDVGLGYQNRNVAGTNRASKHAGGYAIDINPRRNPYTTKIGATEFNPNVINQILAKYPMIEWGGNWKGPRKDYMHFSIKQGIPGYSTL